MGADPYESVCLLWAKYQAEGGGLMVESPKHSLSSPGGYSVEGGVRCASENQPKM